MTIVGVLCHTQSSCSGGPCMSQRNEEPWKAVRPYPPRPPTWAGWVEYSWYQVQKSRSRDSWVQWTKQEVVLASCASTHLLFQTQGRLFSLSQHYPWGWQEPAVAVTMTCCSHLHYWPRGHQRGCGCGSQKSSEKWKLLYPPHDHGSVCL